VAKPEKAVSRGIPRDTALRSKITEQKTEKVSEIKMRSPFNNERKPAFDKTT